MTTPLPPRRLATAPMLDWSDRHYRYMARQISRHAWLYSEMVNALAIVHSDPERHLAFNPEENPVALQLGGSDPQTLAQAAKIGERYGYNEINLNCGCPSPRVQQGAFGACLMLDAPLVAECLNAMQDAVQIPVTIKHRIGVDRQTAYQPLADFVGFLREKTVCRVFIVHARNAWLDGLSPKENRDIPPLRYDHVHRLKQAFPDLDILINGGIADNASIAQQLAHVDGVMIGREAYYNPMLLADWDHLFYQDKTPRITHGELVERLYRYAQRETARGTALRHLTRHYLGLMHGLPGARHWRRTLSDAALLQANDPGLILRAWEDIQNP
ncbi:MAG: tRNA dihydrouridine(20/20a) synthase DusA [Cardiobacteriaceae bacterium]|nr:tRNA dihydrouridine(20/20a) synthase DusA [Cardiobacteriaceae bacterium]